MYNDVFENWQRAYHDFSDAVRQIPPNLQKVSGICGEWSSKELIAHLAGWQREALKRYQDFQNGDSSNKIYDTDQFNADSVAALRLLNWREVFETFQFTCEDLETAAEQLSAQQWENDPRYREWLTEIGNDLDEHTQQIKSWLLAQKDNNA